TMGLDIPSSWVTLPYRTFPDSLDPDNVYFPSLPSFARDLNMSLAVSYRLDRMLVEGQCYEGYQAPQGLQLFLLAEQGGNGVDTHLGTGNSAQFRLQDETIV